MSSFGSNPADDIPLAEVVVAVVQSELPLGVGLRAVAAETHDHRLAKTLEHLATQVDAGQSLEAAIASSPHKLPLNVAALLAAGQHSGRLREAVIDLVDRDVATQDTLRTVYATLAYPTLLLLFAYSGFVAVLWFIIGRFTNLYVEFELELPLPTKALVELHHLRLWLTLGPLVVLLVVGIVLVCLKRSQRHRLLATVPLFGKLFHWCGVAQASRALAHLTRQAIPLPEALRLSSQGLRDANVAEVWNQLADDVEQGCTLAESMEGTRRLPASIAPLVAASKNLRELPESLLLISEMLEGRVRQRAQLIRTLLPPLLFVVIGVSAFLVVFGLYTPLVTLIQNLSG